MEVIMQMNRRLKMSGWRPLLVTLLIFAGGVGPALGQDPEQVEYEEDSSSVRRQAVTSTSNVSNVVDQPHEHLDHIEIDDDLGTYRLRLPLRPKKKVHTVIESPEHEDYIETLAPNDRRASHPIIWSEENEVPVEESTEVLPPPVTELPDGMMFVEGDLVVPEGFGVTAATFTTSQLWTNGVVPYRFDSNVSSGNQSLMINAMNDWEAVANVNFRPLAAGDTSFLHIQNATFNASETIGIAGGQHEIWINNWNNWGVLMHELGHALLYYHEQSRFDRNTYVQVNSGNISQNQCSGDPCDSQFRFRLLNDSEYGPYDFDSVMHYGQCAFSRCNNAIPTCSSSGCGCANNLSICRTITVLPPNEFWQNRIGQRTHLSYFDQKVMAMVYPEDDYVFLDYTNGDVNPNTGDFFDPIYVWQWAVNAVPAGGTIWIIEPGTYAGSGIINKRMKLRAPTGARLSN